MEGWRTVGLGLGRAEEEPDFLVEKEVLGRDIIETKAGLVKGTLVDSLGLVWRTLEESEGLGSLEFIGKKMSFGVSERGGDSGPWTELDAAETLGFDGDDLGLRSELMSGLSSVDLSLSSGWLCS